MDDQNYTDHTVSISLCCALMAFCDTELEIWNHLYCQFEALLVLNGT